MRNNTTSDERSKLDKFKDAARKLKCEYDEMRFNERLSGLDKAKSITPKQEP